VRHVRFAAALAAATGLAAADAHDQPTPVIEELSLTTLPLLPFGGEYLIAATWAGVITSTEVQLSFTTAGNFQAQNFAFAFTGPTGEFSAFGATDLGRHGQGTFTAEFESTGLNGEIVRHRVPARSATGS